MNKTKAGAPFAPLLFIFAASPFLIGLYYEWSCAIISVALSVYLISCKRAAGYIFIPKSPAFYACAVAECFFILSPIWAVDKGMSAFGAIKFLPLTLFVIALSQIGTDEKKKLAETVPITGAVMTVTSLALSFLPVIGEYFTVRGRLAGFMQYSNTFACYLLTGIIIAVGSGYTFRKKIVILSVLIFGIAVSGSRTVWIISAIFLAIFVIKSRNKKLKLSLLGISCAALVLALGYILLVGISDFTERFLSSSTFLGRLLYYKDSLPVIFHHPFGLGYTGYKWLQGSFQTGVYSVVDIHNDYLQLLLDIGWIPFTVSAWAGVKAFLAPGRISKPAAAAIMLHCLLDFDLQFVSMGFILILMLDGDGGEKIKIRSGGGVISAAAIISAVSLYFGAAAGAYYLKNYDLTLKIYPFYTQAYVEKLPAAQTPEEMDNYADKILDLNRFVSLAYSAKARKAFGDGDIEKMIEYKKKAIGYAKYSIEEYRDYREMLEIAEDLYSQAGDMQSAEFCAGCIDEIEGMLEDVREGTSWLGWRIDDKPVFDDGGEE